MQSDMQDFDYSSKVRTVKIEEDKFLGDVFDEVEDLEGEILLGPCYLSYGGVPRMTVKELNEWFKLVGVKGEVIRLAIELPN